MFQEVYKKKKILVTGHTGFKGAWLCQWLLDLGAEVAGFSKDIPTTPSLFESLTLKSLIQHQIGDVRNLSDLTGFTRNFKPDLVFHLAAQALVRPSYDSPRETFETNLMGTVNILEAIRLVPTVKAAVIVTTDKCYENIETLTGYKEDDKLGGKDPYSASKACAEIAAHAYFKSFFKNEDRLKMATVRAGNVIGGGDWAQDRIVADCARAWSKGEKAIIRNPKSIRPWQHVLDSLSGYLITGARLLGDSKGVNGEAFNFAPTEKARYTVQDLVERFKKYWPKANWTDQSDHHDQKAESHLLQLNCEKAKKVLGWKAAFGFDETVEASAQWYKAFYENKSDAPRLTSQQIVNYTQRARAQNLSWAQHQES